MNGTRRLYRSTSDAMLGGVAAGLGQYFAIDPTIVRIAFAGLTIVTGGTFLLAYLGLWLLVPTPGSTAANPNDVFRENIDEIGYRVRGFTGGNITTTGSAGGAGTAPVPVNPPAGEVASASQPLPPATSTGSAWNGISPKVLILVGVFFLLANTGVLRELHYVHWGLWWPGMLIFLGFMMIRRGMR